MNDRDRFRLLGVYSAPRIRLGRLLACEAHDADLLVTGYSDARIPWPIGRRPKTSARSLIVFGGLANAIRRESNQAVCYWFGVTPQTVSKWRKLLGVGFTNPGTNRLRSDYFDEPWAKRARKKSHAKNSDPERRRKIAEAKRGKKRPQHVIEAMRRANLGRVPAEETRAKMSAIGKRRAADGFVLNGRRWTPEENALIRTLPASEAARRMGRSLKSVYARRVMLQVPDGRTRSSRIARKSD